MKAEQFKEYILAMDGEREKVLIDRGDNYSKNVDTLANFKDVATIWNVLHPQDIMDPEGIAEILAILKQVRLANMIRSDRGYSDPSVKDTIIDQHNYIDLRVGCLIDRLGDETTR